MAAAQRAVLATADGDVVLLALANLRLGIAYHIQTPITKGSTACGRPWRPGRGAALRALR